MFKKKLFSILISLVIAISAVIVNPAVSALASILKLRSIKYRVAP